MLVKYISRKGNIKYDSAVEMSADIISPKLGSIYKSSELIDFFY